MHFLQETLCQHILMLPAAARGYIAPLFSKSTQKTACLWVQIPFYILTCPILGMCLFTSGKIYNFLGTFLTVNSYIPKPMSFIPRQLIANTPFASKPMRLLPIRWCTSCQNGFCQHTFMLSATPVGTFHPHLMSLRRPVGTFHPLLMSPRRPVGTFHPHLMSLRRPVGI